MQSRMFLWRYLLVLLGGVGLLSQVVTGALSPVHANTTSQPITTEKSKVGDLLRAWEAAGTAAGNRGDWYDNRDREHSGLNLTLWPQLQKVSYTDEERQRRADWALQSRIIPHVVFGNSSTASPVEQGGSNTRQLYTHPQGLQRLYEQYRQHNLYIYPEHLDHDPGHNGTPGYGDLYPTNTPYLITSQGSSGSDQPFMRALPFLLAAFRPEVKRKLLETGTLMPTIQMIFRMGNKHLTQAKDYLTGKAHPSVFEGGWVDVHKMVLMAQEITLQTLPPVVQLQVISEDEPRLGRDFFEVSLPQRHPDQAVAQRNLEQHADTPAVIARIHRSTQFLRRIVVDASTSFDSNQRPLTFHWQILRGDPEQIKLRPLDTASRRVEMVVPYHGRRPVLPGAALESNRVDIGVFVRNGVYYSAPAFVTFFSLDNEARTYDPQGRILEIGYGTGEATAKVIDWLAFFAWLEPHTAGPVAALVQSLFPAEGRERLLQVATAYRPAKETEDNAATQRKAAEAERHNTAEQVKRAEQARAAAVQAQQKTPGPTAAAALTQATEALELAQKAALEADTTAREARQAHEIARRAVAEVLTPKGSSSQEAWTNYVERTFQVLVRHPRMLEHYARVLQPLWDALSPATKARLDAERRALVLWGLIQDSTGLPLQFTPLRTGTAPLETRLTPFEQTLLERFQTEFLKQVVFPSVVTITFKPNYVDPSFTARKFWRDIYHYDATGRNTGWTRFDGQRQVEFNADGFLVEARDNARRVVKARTVMYQPETPRDPKASALLQPLRMLPGPEFVYYTYEGSSDTQWRELRREPVPELPAVQDPPPAGR